MTAKLVLASNERALHPSPSTETRLYRVTPIRLAGLHPLFLLG